MATGGDLIGIDIGCTRTKAVAVGADGEERGRDEIATPEGTEALATQVGELVTRLEARCDGVRDALGIAAPGVAAADHASIGWMQGRLEAIQGFDWPRALGRPVRVLNDALAATLGEWWIGAARGRRNVLLLTLGTGIGGGVVCDGRLLRGHLGRAGHVGHLCLDPHGPPDICRAPGSLEEAFADCGVERRSKGRFTTNAELVAAMSSGDDEAAALWSEAVRSLACGLASLINVVDPEIVVLAGGATAAGDQLLGPLREEMAAVEWRPYGAGVPIVIGALGSFAGAFGAARFLLEDDLPAAAGAS